jgi:hypothetical protein
MKEDLLYFIWKFKYFNTYKLYNFDVDHIQIISPGIQNDDSGPDFTDVKILAGQTIWAGNIEIDIKSSDWYKHGHHTRPEYNNVLLQVVTNHDKQVLSENGRLVPVLELQVEQGIIEKYQQFISNKNLIPCSKDIGLVDPFKIQYWLGKTLTERFIDKSGDITKLLSQNKNNWEETFYQLLARSFGFHVNADPFEWLAKSIPLKYLSRHHKNLIQLEALLYGQAGFLEDTLPTNPYYTELKNEYLFLRNKYQLTPMDKHLWKFLRIRPSNFPTIRISQFANLIFRSNSLFSKIINETSVISLKHFFQTEASPFWDNHYHFIKDSKPRKKLLGNQSVEKLIINTVLPILFVYGSYTNNEAIKEKAIGFLDGLKPEKNALIEQWRQTGIRANSAFMSQSLLHQRKAYCEKEKCLECGIGIEILKKQYLKT